MSETSSKPVAGTGFFNRLADILILNFLFMICCIPIVTIFCSAASMYSVMLRIVRNEEEGVVKPFFRFFGRNFVKSLPYMALLALAFVLVMSGLMIAGYNDSAVMAGIVLGIAVILLTWNGWVTPLFAQFDNTVGAMLMNGLRLMKNNLRESLVILILNSYLFILFAVSPTVLTYVLYVWMFVGSALAAWITCNMLVPIFDSLIAPQEATEESDE